MIKERDGNVVGIELRACRVGARVRTVPAICKLAGGIRIQDIRVPQRERASRAVHSPCLLPETEDNIRGPHLTRYDEFVIEMEIGCRHTVDYGGVEDHRTIRPESG